MFYGYDNEIPFEHGSALQFCGQSCDWYLHLCEEGDELDICLSIKKTTSDTYKGKLEEDLAGMSLWDVICRTTSNLCLNRV